MFLKNNATWRGKLSDCTSIFQKVNKKAEKYDCRNVQCFTLVRVVFSFSAAYVLLFVSKVTCLIVFSN